MGDECVNQKSSRQLKIIGLVLILTILLISIVLIQSASPMRKAKKQSIKISEEIANIKDVDDFYWFTREKTYFTVVGKDNEKTEKIVFIPQDGTEAVVMNAEQGLESHEAVQKVLDLKETKKIKKISLGLYDNKPVWEIVANSVDEGIKYYLVDFSNGDIVNTIS